jgi:hypothetical protein
MNISLLIAVGTPVQKTGSTFFPYTPKDSKVFSNTSQYANWDEDQRVPNTHTFTIPAQGISSPRFRITTHDTENKHCTSKFQNMLLSEK